MTRSLQLKPSPLKLFPSLGFDLEEKMVIESRVLREASRKSFSSRRSRRSDPPLPCFRRKVSRHWRGPRSNQAFFYRLVGLGCKEDDPIFHVPYKKSSKSKDQIVLNSLSFVFATSMGSVLSVNIFPWVATSIFRMSSRRTPKPRPPMQAITSKRLELSEISPRC